MKTIFVLCLVWAVSGVFAADDKEKKTEKRGLDYDLGYGGYSGYPLGYQGGLGYHNVGLNGGYHHDIGYHHNIAPLHHGGYPYAPIIKTGLPIAAAAPLGYGYGHAPLIGHGAHLGYGGYGLGYGGYGLGHRFGHPLLH